MIAPTSAAHDRRIALERAMIRVRWFGVVLGVYQTLSYVPNPGTFLPETATRMSLAGLAVLLTANVVLAVAMRRGLTEHTLRRAGAVMFALDMAALWTIIWAYSFEPFGNTWVTLTILTLEGALRYQLRGAMIPIAFAVPIEIGREIYRATSVDALDMLGGSYFLTGVTFRIGVLLMVGAIAGSIARNLERARAAAEERAATMEILAAEERRAKAESSAFQNVILAGVSAESIEDTLTSMAEVIGREFGYERVAVLMREGDHLVVVALYGFDENVRAELVRLGQGIAGKVALTGVARVIDDVTADPDYYPVDHTTRSQVTLPIRAGDEILGVLDVESPRGAAFVRTDLDRLARLCDQMALVIQNARLLATERAAVERLRDVDQMKSDFVAIASHELRTPLTSMQGSIKTLLRTADLPEAARTELLAILDRQTERLARLVDDLLLTSRIEAGRIQIRIGRTDLTAVVDEVLDELGPEAERVSVAIAPRIPAMLTDAQRLTQILRNLIENALKFSPPGSPVRVTAHGGVSGLVLEIADDGPGIPEHERVRIFERFHQAGPSESRAADGLGLGLYITQRLTEALGGAIAVESAIGEGTTFRITLPLAAAGDESDTA